MESRSEEHTSELQSRRDLHSFPTRRSSDLLSKPRFLRDEDARSFLRLGRHSRSSGRWTSRRGCRGRALRALCHRPGTVTRLVRLRCRWRSDAGLQWRADRKSTRLNSSHVEIYTLSLHDALPICCLNRGSCGTKTRGPFSGWDAIVALQGDGPAVGAVEAERFERCVIDQGL